MAFAHKRLIPDVSSGAQLRKRHVPVQRTTQTSASAFVQAHRPPLWWWRTTLRDSWRPCHVCMVAPLAHGDTRDHKSSAMCRHHLFYVTVIVGICFRQTSTTRQHNKIDMSSCDLVFDIHLVSWCAPVDVEAVLRRFKHALQKQARSSIKTHHYMLLVLQQNIHM
jgi:hypothetical protein